MNSTEREHLEKQVLLRGSGELSPAELATLEPLLACDAESSALARFIETQLPFAARAPRDFAAEAIASQHHGLSIVHASRDFAAEAIAAGMPERKRMAMPRHWALAAAAAVLVLTAITIHFLREPDSIQGATPRITVAITERLDELEFEISAPSSRMSRGRHRAPSQL